MGGSSPFWRVAPLRANTRPEGGERSRATRADRSAEVLRIDAFLQEQRAGRPAGGGRGTPCSPWPTAAPRTLPRVRDRIVLGENLDVLRTLPDGGFELVYMDPPFNTGRKQTRRTLTTTADEGGDRTGFGGRRYRSR